MECLDLEMANSNRLYKQKYKTSHHTLSAAVFLLQAIQEGQHHGSWIMYELSYSYFSW